MQQLHCEGLADREPLPNVAPTASAQRRVALVFISVQGELAQQVRALFARKIAH